MPAITADYLRLPRLDGPPRDASERPVLSVTTAPTGLEGEGFPVHRAFAGVSRALLDPFVHMDQMGAVQYAPGEPKGTPWHPHRGFETVTYMIDGRFQHQDSHGGGGMIQDGATQWMTAGSGILHIETPPEDLVMSGGLFHGEAGGVRRCGRVGSGDRRRGRWPPRPGVDAHAHHADPCDRFAGRAIAIAVGSILQCAHLRSCWRWARGY